MIINNIRKFLETHNKFLISAHTSPEGDCLGAELTFYRALRHMGKIAQILNADNYSKEYFFLPGIKVIKNKPSIENFDAAIILDCSDISRIGNIQDFMNGKIPILNIDHHISNTNFGNINLVEPESSSVCEILYFLFEKLNIKIDRKMAICLYSGILTDTGSFRYTNTNRKTHLAVSQLMKYKIDVAQIYRNVWGNLNFSDLEFINQVLLNLKKDSSESIAWAQIPRELFMKYKPKIDLTDNILNFIRYVKGVEVCLILREMIGESNNIRVNLRSKGKIDVNKIAQHFGGGGHKTASGITLRNTTLKEAENKIIRFIQKLIKR